MMDALEVARKVFHLPALIGPDLMRVSPQQGQARSLPLSS